MSTHAEARPLPSARPLPALAIGLLGAAVSLSPYAWLEAWQTYGFATDYLGFHVWVAVPFWALAALLALGRISLPAAGREIGRTLVIIAPILLAAAAPAVTLGAHAVDQKRTADGATSLARLAVYDESAQPIDRPIDAYG